MATLNLGRIKPVFRGAYAGGTAYVIDDIVTSGDETFICIQAGTGNATSNASYWTKLAAKGTDGTDVGTTITTQGDILYRDGSGLQRLAKGTAGQVLKINAGATAPEWGTDAGGGVKQVKTAQTGDTWSISTVGNLTSGYEVTPLTITMTPTSANSYFLIQGMFNMSHPTSYTGKGYISYDHSGISETIVRSSNGGNYSMTFRIEDFVDSTSYSGQIGINLMVAPNTTNALTFRCRVNPQNSSHPVYINRNTNGSSTDGDDGTYTISTMTVWEIDGSISPNIANDNITT